MSAPGPNELPTRLGSVFVISAPSGKGHQAAQNRINSKHVDFLICDRERLEPRLVVELDDSSHSRPDRQSRDQNVDQFLASASLPIIHFRCKKAYVLEDVASQISAALGIHGA